MHALRSDAVHIFRYRAFRRAPAGRCDAHALLARPAVLNIFYLDFGFSFSNIFVFYQSAGAVGAAGGMVRSGWSGLATYTAS